MAKVSRYFMYNNNPFAKFSLNFTDVTLNDSVISISGTEDMDSVYLAKGFSFDFTKSGLGADKIYLSENWADYKFYKTTTTAVNDTLVLYIAASANIAKTEIKVLTGDQLVFKDGAIAVADVINFVGDVNNSANTSLSLAKPNAAAGFNAAEESSAYDALAEAANVGSSLHAYAQAESNQGIVFSQVHKTAMIVRGSAGVDVVYVSDGSHVLATDLADGEDIIYLTHPKSNYSPSFTGKILKLSLLDGDESVTIFSGDKLVFADGTITVRAELS